MKTAIKLLALAAMLSVGTEVSAQGFLKKLEKAANKALSATDKVLDGADKALDATDAILGETTPADSTKKSIGRLFLFTTLKKLQKQTLTANLYSTKTALLKFVYSSLTSLAIEEARKPLRNNRKNFGLQSALLLVK